MYNDLSHPIKSRGNDTTLKLFKTTQRLEKIVICNNQQYQQGLWKEKIQRFILNSFFSSISTGSNVFQVWNSYRENTLQDI